MRQAQPRRLTVLRFPDPRLLLAAALLALLGMSSLLTAEPLRPALAPALFGRSLVIDAGHGGWDPGMVGPNSVEKEINLAVALALAEYCRAGGAAVSLTRESDQALDASKPADMALRVELAEAAPADLFISLHCNSFVSGPSQRGAQVFFQRDNEAGRELALTVQQRLAAELGNTDRQALPHADSYLLKNISAPAVICEMGFLSNPEEEALLIDSAYQWQLAWSLYLAIVDYYSINAPS